MQKNINELKNLVKLGNKKIAKNTLIFNISSATNCCNQNCLVKKYCYALKAEKMYKQVLPYKQRQAFYWNNSNIEKICKDLEGLFTLKKFLKIDYFRLNESGDFRNYDDILKFNAIAKFLVDNYNIKSFTYSSRFDLFKGIDASQLAFNVKISGYSLPTFKSTILIDKKLRQFVYYKDFEASQVFTNIKDYTFKDNDFLVCPSQLDKRIQCMKDCTLCQTKHYNLAFIKH